MRDEARRLKRARLIERVRMAEKRKVAADAYEAEAHRARMAGISERTALLGKSYSGRTEIEDGAELRSVVALAAQLRELGITAARQADHARQEADARLTELAHADRRQKKAEEDRRSFARLLRDMENRPVLAATRKTGTDLD